MSADAVLPLKPGVVSADRMLAMLRAHYLPEYRNPAGIFAPEIGAPDGRRRADLIWLQTSGGRRELVGHEIKVTRADLKHELDHPDKCVSWKKYCDRWWLVVPDLSVIDGFTLPADWGVLLPPSGRRTRAMTVLRAAPKLTPPTQDPALRQLAIWLWYRQRDAVADAAKTRNERDYARSRVADLEQQIADWKQRWGEQVISFGRPS